MARDGEEAPCSILVVTGSVGHQAALVYEAMGQGALDVVNLPAQAIAPCLLRPFR